MRIIKKIVLLLLPNSLKFRLKAFLNLESVYHRLNAQQLEIEALRGDVNRLLSLNRVNQFNKLN